MVQERKHKPVTKAYLERAALHYLGRFSSTKANLKDVLGRRVRRRNEGGVSPNAEQLTWIDEVADKCEGYGYIDDAEYARQRFESLLRKGKPLRAIALDLRHKGVPDDIAKAAISAAEEGEENNPDKAAAAAYARRRRFGPFRRADRVAEDKLEKEKAAMMRAGFPYVLVVETLESSEEELLSRLP